MSWLTKLLGIDQGKLDRFQDDWQRRALAPARFAHQNVIKPIGQDIGNFTRGAGAALGQIPAGRTQRDIEAQNAAQQAQLNARIKQEQDAQKRQQLLRIQQRSLENVPNARAAALEGAPTNQEVAKGAITLASFALPGARIPGAIAKASPAVRLLGSSAIRGAEGAAYGAAYDIAEGKNASEVVRNIPRNLAFGAAANAVLSPKLSYQAAKEVPDLVRQTRANTRAMARPGYAPGFAKVPGGETQKYIQEQVRKQKIETPGFRDALKEGGKEIKKKFVDFTAPIEETLAKAKKAGKYDIRPTQDIRYQIDRVLRSPSLASQYVKDQGLDTLIKNVDDLDSFNQYLIARQADDVAKYGIKTGRDAVKDKNLVAALSPKYEQLASGVYEYNKKLLNIVTDAGLISPELRDSLIKKYPNYVPLNRIFDDVDGVITGSGKGVASISKQSVVQKLKGSEREIANPLESILSNTEKAFKQIEKNRAAQMLGSYESLPGNPFGLRKLAAGETVGSKNTVSALINGKKVTWEAPAEIAAAAKALDIPQLGLVERIIRVPTRVLQATATALNLPFVVTNLAKDQMTTFINSNRAAKTSLLNPVNFVKSVYEAVGRGKVYDDWIRSAGGGTAFDITRDQVAPTIKRIRASRNIGSKISHTVRNPGEMLRALEDIIGVGEEITRVQNYKGTLDKLLKEGRTLEDAKILAAEASRMNTANFARRGEWGRALNTAIPFFNAGIQGARSFTSAFKNKPLATSAKFVTAFGIPMTAAVVYNISDPARKQAYEDIPEYEKENNLIFIIDPTPDENGRYKSVKIPLPPGMSNIASIIRRQVEELAGYDSQSIAKIASDLVTGTTSIEPTTRGIINKVTPQGAKPFIESATNTNLFTGFPIVSPGLADLPPELQYRDSTSETAKKIGSLTGTSPLKVENTIRTSLAGVGSQLLNISDRLLGDVTPGGEGAVANIKRRFSQASGGELERQQYEEEDRLKRIRGIEKKLGTGEITQSQADALISKEEGKRKPINLFEGAAASEDKRIIQSRSDGKFVFYDADNTRRSFDTLEQAKIGIAKDDFKKTGKKIQVGDDVVFKLTDGGDVTTQKRLDYDISVLDGDNGKLSLLKRQDKYNEWLKEANRLMGLYKRKLEEAETEEEVNEATLDIIRLQEDAAKYAEYGGGFKKPKKGRKGVSAKVASFPSFPKASARRGARVSMPSVSAQPRVSREYLASGK